MNLPVQLLFFLCLLTSSLCQAQDACDKCSMMREEYELAASPRKEELYVLFKQECLETETVYVTDDGKPEEASLASSYQEIAYGKCIPYREVKQYDKASKNITASYLIDKDTVYTFGSTVPHFPGGDTELVKFIRANMRKPQGKSAMPVTVYVRFIVRKNGEITDIKITRSSSQVYNEEAIRLVDNMPSWVAGTFREKPVDMYCTIPVKFPGDSGRR